MGAIDEISKTIKAVRQAKGLSQLALAKTAGMPQSHISRIENGGVNLRLTSLTEIARALDLELTLVPRKAIPAVRSIVSGAQVGAPKLTVRQVSRPAYSLEDDDG
ncbi:MAG: helix-turn-helix transcriptional regulator [Gammaproteobacteria bacterium]|nr:helix-turn-helix transcriptional regulator [Gammaproteobacteria bacterium]MYF01087.1 helix-turn-helix transcriptional regulator [Gammaproteobacteria bacterium]MYG97542.1 helix-turn-helix transcriptional regulator [Gammaproteobacteria bacterium]